MIVLAQASDGGMWLFLALGIGLVALAALGTHLIWFFRFLRSFGKGNVLLSARFYLGVIGLTAPVVGIIHGFAIWAGAGARVGD